jgi:hypothetical protein
MGLTPVFGVKRKCTVFRCDDVVDGSDAVLEYTKKKKRNNVRMILIKSFYTLDLIARPTAEL